MATERYHPLVAADLREAWAHYDAIASSLGDQFRESVQMKIQTITERPESFGRIVGEFRGAMIDRFPYVVVFTVDNDVPCIYGIRHAASDRKTWFRRTMPDTTGQQSDQREPE